MRSLRTSLTVAATCGLFACEAAPVLPALDAGPDAAPIEITSDAAPADGAAGDASAGDASAGDSSAGDAAPPDTDAAPISTPPADLPGRAYRLTDARLMLGEVQPEVEAVFATAVGDPIRAGRAHFVVAFGAAVEGGDGFQASLFLAEPTGDMEALPRFRPVSQAPALAVTATPAACLGDGPHCLSLATPGAVPAERPPLVLWLPPPSPPADGCAWQGLRLRGAVQVEIPAEQPHADLRFEAFLTPDDAHRFQVPLPGGPVALDDGLRAAGRAPDADLDGDGTNESWRLVFGGVAEAVLVAPVDPGAPPPVCE